MSYQVLSRRYRPKVFGEVIGQASIVKILTNAITSKNIPHAFLFTGIRGTGKTTTARIFARSLNCKNGVLVDPCNQCESCLQLLEGRSMDVMEIDGASNTSVNDVRMIRENTRFMPSQLRYKVYIIDEVHMLSNEAFNALLKTLEEPPPYVVFILATTEAEKIPETVLSRCIRLNFRRVEPKEIAQYLVKVLSEEKIPYEDNAVFQIARQSGGSVRDALSFTELVLAYGGGKVLEQDVVQALGLLSRDKVFEMLGFLADRNASEILNLLDAVWKEGGNLFSFLSNTVFYLRHMVMASLKVPFDKREFSQEETAAMTALTAKFSSEELVVYYQGIIQLMEQIRFSPYPQYDVEVGIMKLVLLKEFLEHSPTFPHKTAGKAKTEGEKPPVQPVVATSRTASDTPEKPAEKAEPSASAKPTAQPVTAQKKTDTAREGTFVEFLKKTKPLLASQVENAAITLTDNAVTIVFGRDHHFFYEHLNHGDGELEQLRKLAREFYGRNLTVALKYDETAGAAEAAPGNGTVNIKQSVMDNEKINLVLKEFEGAKIIDMKRVEPRNAGDEPEDEPLPREEEDE